MICGALRVRISYVKKVFPESRRLLVGRASISQRSKTRSVYATMQPGVPPLPPPPSASMGVQGKGSDSGVSEVMEKSDAKRSIWRVCGRVCVINGVVMREGAMKSGCVGRVRFAFSVLYVASSTVEPKPVTSAKLLDTCKGRKRSVEAQNDDWQHYTNDNWGNGECQGSHGVTIAKESRYILNETQSHQLILAKCERTSACQALPIAWYGHQ